MAGKKAKSGGVKYYVVEEMWVPKLRRAAKRLYTEDRLNGDEMRDMAQMIDAVVRGLIELPEDWFSRVSRR